MKQVFRYVMHHKSRAFFLCVALILIIFLIWRLFFPYVVNMMYSMGDNLSEYKRTFCLFWNEKNPYAVYPEKRFIRAADSCDYHLYYDKFPLFNLLFDNDILATLKCNYSQADFDCEIQRLSELCGNPDQTHFSYPAYVYTSEARAFMEYALVNRNNHSIYYFSVQNMRFARKYIDPKYLPLSWSAHSQPYQQNADTSSCVH